MEKTDDSGSMKSFGERRLEAIKRAEKAVRSAEADLEDAKEAVKEARKGLKSLQAQLRIAIQDDSEVLFD